MLQLPPAIHLLIKLIVDIVDMHNEAKTITLLTVN